MALAKPGGWAHYLACRPGLLGPRLPARGPRSLLLFINLFNYVDRQVLAAVVPSIERSFFGVGAGRPVAP